MCIMKRIYKKPQLRSVMLGSSVGLLSGSTIPVGGTTEDVEPNESKRYIESILDILGDEEE